LSIVLLMSNSGPVFYTFVSCVYPTVAWLTAPLSWHRYRKTSSSNDLHVIHSRRTFNKRKLAVDLLSFFGFFFAKRNSRYSAAQLLFTDYWQWTYFSGFFRCDDFAFFVSYKFSLCIGLMWTVHWFNCQFQHKARSSSCHLDALSDWYRIIFVVKWLSWYQSAVRLINHCYSL